VRTLGPTDRGRDPADAATRAWASGTRRWAPPSQRGRPRSQEPCGAGSQSRRSRSARSMPFGSPLAGI